MNARQHFSLITFGAAAAIVLSCAAVASQTGSATQSAAQALRQAQRQAQHQAQAQSKDAPLPSEKDVADTQDQLLHLLRLSPTLTSVVAADPSLLADQQYVARNNPELAQFLLSHPDVPRNPDFYLFSNLNSKGGRRDQALKRAVWPEMAEPNYQDAYAAYRYSPAGAAEEIVEKVMMAIIILALFGAIFWLIRMFMESRRWNRTFKQQSEIHARLIDKFSSSQELAAYMETEAGKQFLSATAYAPGPQAGPRMPNVVARVLTPLQVGIVMTLLGIGLLFLPRQGAEIATMVLGILALMPGIGFILSAGATWIIARRLGLMPGKGEEHNGAAGLAGRQ